MQTCKPDEGFVVPNAGEALLEPDAGFGIGEFGKAPAHLSFRSTVMKSTKTTVAIVFSGGLGLGAYHAGAYQSYAKRSAALHWVAGSSAGALTAALIAGNRSDDRIECLRAFWNHPPIEQYVTSPWRHLSGWMAAIQTRLVGSAGHFYPRIPPATPFAFRSLYDAAPMKHRLLGLIDFDRLNSGEIRVCVAATDIETGEPVIFDSRNSRIEIDHLMASCGFLPEFAPVEVDGRLLGDGGLSLNAPFDPILQSDVDGDLLLYVIDLYARDGERPNSFEAAAERKNDLMFGNQTLVRLKYCAELRKLRRKHQPGNARDKIVILSYRPGLEEPGPEKSFDLSSDALAQRWIAGALDMEYAEHFAREDDLLVVRRNKTGDVGQNRGKSEARAAFQRS
jgi:NTE family protein